MHSNIFSALVKVPMVCGRVIAHNRNLYTVMIDGQERPAQLTGTLRHISNEAIDLPVIGDYVSIRLEESTNLIEQILPRQNLFCRRAIDGSHSQQPIAANLDTLFITVSANKDFNIRRLERYAVAATAYGVPFAIALTKIDLVDDPQRFVQEIQSTIYNAPVLPLCALKLSGGQVSDYSGLAAFEAFTGSDRTIAFVGSSGAGKSTLINALLGTDTLAVNNVRQADDRGKHTTTTRCLLYRSDGTAIIDTPGMREFALSDAEEGINAFQDIVSLAINCKFRDCRHNSEPGCAVRDVIDDTRLSSWRKLAREAAFKTRKTDYRAAAQEKERWKAIQKANAASQR